MNLEIIIFSMILAYQYRLFYQFTNIPIKVIFVMIKPLLLLLLAITINAIYLPVKSNRARCLIEYLLGGVSTSIKIKINFPKIAAIEAGEHFIVSFRNTETNKTDTDIVQSGDRYAKEADLDKNVIYEVCTMLRTERDLEVMIEYLAESIYTHDHSQIQVPKSLLTKSDMKGAFISAAYLAKILNEYTEQHQYRTKNDTNAFLQTEKLNHKLTLLSSIELAAIICAGLYQFFTLKNHLSSKQYI